jgi:hypothetical protein
MNDIEAMERHIQGIRAIYLHGPLTIGAYTVVKIWSFISMLLVPVGWAFALVVWCVIFIPVLRLPIFAVQGLIYLPMFAVLMATSRLWFRRPYLRPLLIVPGVAMAIIASAFLTTFGVEQDQVARFRKISDAEEWPLTSLLWEGTTW